METKNAEIQLQDNRWVNNISCKWASRPRLGGVVKKPTLLESFGSP